MFIPNYTIRQFKSIGLTIIIILLLNVTNVYSQSFTYDQDSLRCEYLARDIERKYKLPDNILLSISRVESGYRKVNGVTRSWPWTLNAGGDSAYFDNKEDAIASLKARINNRVTNIDVGCMQLNYRWHKKFFRDLDEMMEPIKNVDYAARFLKKLYKRHGSWEKAVKYYHSSKSKFNVSYYKKVKAVWKRENAQNSLMPTLLASKIKTENEKAIIVEKREPLIPLIKVANDDVMIYDTQKRDDRQEPDQDKVIKVTTANFEKMVDGTTEFDFTSFVKSVSQKNSAIPKYIRDNWAIVVSIRNQLENNN